MVVVVPIGFWMAARSLVVRVVLVLLVLLLLENDERDDHRMGARCHGQLLLDQRGRALGLVFITSDSFIACDISMGRCWSVHLCGVLVPCLVLSVPFYFVFWFLDLVELVVLWQGRRLIQLVFVHTPDLTLCWPGWKFITSV